MASEGTGDSLLVARQQGVKAKPESARDEWVVECAAQLFLEGGELESYGREVDSFYIIFDDAYKLGVSDGSVLILPDFATFYKSVAHALVSVAEKMARGEVIPSDDFSDGMEELDCIVDMAVKYVRK